MNIDPWDPLWNQPDPKILTLKNQIDMLNSKADLEPVMDQVKLDIAELDKQFRKQAIEIKTLQLFALGKVSPEEYRRLMTMFSSPDEENYVVAIEMVNNLIKNL